MHTPPPWTLQTVLTASGICHKIGPFPGKKHQPDRPGWACVYVDYPGNGPVEAELLANARLIAAAPDLLAALIKLSNEVIGSMHLSEETIREAIGNTNYKILIRRAEEARAAIAIATGT